MADELSLHPLPGDQAWRGLHDRLIALVDALLADAVERGEPLGPLLDRLAARTAVPVQDLVGALPTPQSVAGLLRAHGSYGEVDDGGDVVTFVHDCGTGLVRWRADPDQPLVDDGEVAGVPGGVTRYCARCIHAVAHAGGGVWSVAVPPPSPAPDSRCTWVVRRR